MCDLDYLEPFEFYHQKVVKARKPHKCTACGGLILVGEKYLKHVDRFEGEFHSEKMCDSCRTSQDYFSEMHNNIITAPSSFRKLIYECLDERESLSMMLKWKRILRGMDKRKMIEEQPK